MVIIGLILILLGFIYSFFIGVRQEKWENHQLFISIIIAFLLTVFGIGFLIDGVEKIHY